jgi:hypothetical protein
MVHVGMNQTYKWSWFESGIPFPGTIYRNSANRDFISAEGVTSDNTPSMIGLPAL